MEESLSSVVCLFNNIDFFIDFPNSSKPLFEDIRKTLYENKPKTAKPGRVASSKNFPRKRDIMENPREKRYGDHKRRGG
jgi:hypothetical protein